MDNKSVMYRFIKMIEESKLLTKFIMRVFNYNDLYDYNYIFRVVETDYEIIIDIYDNVSIHRFNRYIYDFKDVTYEVIETIDDDVFVKKISVINAHDSDINFFKLGYLFKLKDELIIEYASSFLDSEIVNIIKDIIK